MAGLSWPLPDEVDDRRLEKLLFPAAVGRPTQRRRPLPDFAEIQRQLQTHRHLTLQLLWEEYRERQPHGYGYSRFCELYQRWSRNQDLVLRQEHRAGEKMFVDWAGATIPVYDPRTGEITPASLFVAVLGTRTDPGIRPPVATSPGSHQIKRPARGRSRSSQDRDPAPVGRSRTSGCSASLALAKAIDEALQPLQPPG